MGMTMIEKILARKAGKDKVTPGEIVVCKVDRVVEAEHIAEVGWDPERVWDSDRIAVVIDHQAPPATTIAAERCKVAREYAKKHGIRLFELGRTAITHQLAAEQGYALPGTLLINPDSHTCSVGAYNCAARGVGRLETLYAVCKGETWFRLGSTIRFVIKGKLPAMVMPRDIIHFIAGKYGAVTNRNVEFVGPTVEEMSLAGRQSMATMCAEINAEFALFEADQKTIDYFKGRTSELFTPVKSDEDAIFEAVYEVDVSNLEPQVVLPGAVPKNVKPVTEVAGIEIHQAFLGSCANGRFEDLQIAAEILKGRKVHPRVRFIITPASQEVYKEALKAGLIETFIDAECLVTNPTCGACVGIHMGLLADGECCISSSTRSFKGRMGSPDSEVFLGSPAVVAASAVTGVITDPRRLFDSIYDIRF